jgi:hypothetical protein
MSYPDFKSLDRPVMSRFYRVDRAVYNKKDAF